MPWQATYHLEDVFICTSSARAQALTRTCNHLNCCCSAVQSRGLCDTGTTWPQDLAYLGHVFTLSSIGLFFSDERSSMLVIGGRGANSGICSWLAEAWLIWLVLASSAGCHSTVGQMIQQNNSKRRCNDSLAGLAEACKVSGGRTVPHKSLACKPGVTTIHSLISVNTAVDHMYAELSNWLVTVQGSPGFCVPAEAWLQVFVMSCVFLEHVRRSSKYSRLQLCDRTTSALALTRSLPPYCWSVTRRLPSVLHNQQNERLCGTVCIQTLLSSQQLF